MGETTSCEGLVLWKRRGSTSRGDVEDEGRNEVVLEVTV